MTSLIALFSIFILCASVKCDIITTTIKPQSAMILKENNSRSLEKETPWSKYTEKLEDNKINKNTMETLNKRKSKFLGSLAFLAGLGFGGLASAASSTVKAYAKFPQASIAMNFVPSKQGPYLAAYYEPYPFVHNPYFYHSPLGFYPLVDPSKLQSLTGGSSQQNGINRPTQIITLFDDKRPSDSDSDDSEEEYIVEKTKTDKSTSSNRLQNHAENTKFRIDSVYNKQTEGETTNGVVACGTRNKLKEEATDVSNRDSIAYDLEELQEDADDSKTIMNRVKNQAHNSTTFRPVNSSTVRPNSRPNSRPNLKPTQRPIPTPIPMPTPTPNPRPTTTDTHTEGNSTTMESNISSTPFFGYYGGNPQDIEHIDLISDMQPPIYHESNPINYHLPYERPASFYPEEKYQFYSNSFPNSYPSGPFISEHITDYSSNDFNRFVYPPDKHSPPYANQFKPLTYS